MALESLPKIAPALFSAEQDLIQIYNKKTDTTGVINASLLGGSTPPSGVSGAIQFSNGSAFASDAANFFWDDTNNRLGIGTNAPSASLQVIGITDIARFGTLTNYWRFNSNYAADQSLEMVNQGGSGSQTYYNTKLLNETYQTKLLFGEYQNYLSFGKYDNHRMVSLFNNGNFVIGSSTDLNARLGVRGAGSTSATTSLLVQNSAGTAALTVKDDLTSTFGGVVKGGEGSNFNEIYFYGGGDRKIKPGANQLDITDSAGTSGFQVGGGGGFPRVALGYDSVDFIRGNATLSWNQSTTQQVVLSAKSYVNHLTPFFDIKATGYANSKNTDLRLYTDNTTSGTYGNIIIGHNGTNATGNVGIGTSSPGSKLTVDGNISVVNNNSIIGYIGSNQGMYLTGGAGEFRFINGNGAGWYYTWYQNGGVEKMRLSTGDNLLIGTTSDLARLQVKGSGSTSATTSLLVQNSAGSTALEVKDNLKVGMGGAFTDGSSGFGITVASMSATFPSIIFNGSGSGGSKAAISLDAAKLYFAQETSASAYGNRIMMDCSVGGFVVRNDTTLGAIAALNASAALQADSTTRGFLPPRMTDAQIRAIASPAEGLIAYNTTISHLCCYQAGAWVKFNHSPM